jgi:hypothetical protein
MTTSETGISRDPVSSYKVQIARYFLMSKQCEYLLLNSQSNRIFLKLFENYRYL